jgi:hypothetical protein
MKTSSGRENHMRAIPAISAGIMVAALVLAGAAPPAAAPQEKIVIRAECAIPFSASVPDEAMKVYGKVLPMEKIEPDRKWLEKLIREQLDAHRKEIEKADAGYFVQIDKRLAELADQAQKSFADAGREKAVADGCAALLAHFKAAVEKDKPVLTISSEYRYEPGKIDRGVPGWKTPPELRVTGVGAAEKSVIPLDQKIALVAAGVPLTVSVSMRAHIGISSEYQANNGNIYDLSTPESPASSAVLVKIKATIELSSDNGALGRNGQLTRKDYSGNWSLPRVQGTIQAVAPAR